MRVLAVHSDRFAPEYSVLALSVNRSKGVLNQLDCIEPAKGGDSIKFLGWSGTPGSFKYKGRSREVGDSRSSFALSRASRARFLYLRHGDAWKAVETGESYGVERDRYNKIIFKAITTNALRLEVTLQPDWSAGIQEWKVK